MSQTSVFEKIRNRRMARQARLTLASADAALAKAFSMSPEEQEAFVKSFVRNPGGLQKLIDNIQMILTEAKRKKDPDVTAQMYQGQSKDRLEPQSPHADQLKHKLDAGDWMFFLAFIIALGQSGNIDMGKDLREILGGFALASGSALLGWIYKKAKEWLSR